MEELDNEIEMIKNSKFIYYKLISIYYINFIWIKLLILCIIHLTLDTHPDLVESIKKIEAKKDERIRMANAWKRYQLECIDNQFRIYYKELDSSRQVSFNKLKIKYLIGLIIF